MGKRPARIREFLAIYQKEGLKGVEEFFSREEIPGGGWLQKIKKLWETGINTKSIEAEINLILYKHGSRDFNDKGHGHGSADPE